MSKLTAAAPDGAGFDDPLAGPGASFWLTLGARVESATAAIEEHNRRYRRLWASVHRVQVTGPELAATAGAIADVPDLLGPRRGWYWDIRRLTFTASPVAAPLPGQILLWRNDPVSVHLIDSWPASDPETYTHTYGKGQLLLGPDERLVYGWAPAASPAAGWSLAGEAIQVADDCLPMYLT